MPIDRRVGVVQSDGEVVYGRASDISLGGMSIKCRHSADIGQRFNVILQLGGGRSEPFEARVKVVYVHFVGTEHLHRLGVRFVDFIGDGRERLSDFVSERLR